MLKLNLKRWVVLLAVAFCCWSFTNGLNITIERNDDLLISYDNSNQNQDGNNATTSAYDRKALLESMLGPQKKPFSFVFFMGTTYMLIFICGIIGNISTCFVVIFNNCMHTTTNYYLFSLAVSDVLSLLMGLPPELYSIVIQAYPWVFGETFCVIRTFIFETTTIASVLTILTFTFERWLHICKAIYAKKFSSGFSRALKIILFIWLVSGLLATPYAFTTGVYYQFPEYVESRTCNILDKHKDLMKRVIQISVLFLFIMPMTLISIMYVLIGITLWKSQTRHKCFNSTNNSAKSNQSAAGLAAAQVTRERGGFSRLSRFFHRPSSTAMNAFNHTNAGGNMVNGGVQTTSLMRKHGGGGSAGAGLTTFRGGISSMKSKTPKFKFIYPSQQSQSSQSHESSTSGNGVLPGATLSVKKPSLASNKSSSPAAAAAAAGTKSAKIGKKNVSDYLLVSHAGGGANNATANNTTNRNNERKLSDFSVGDFSICYGNTTNGVGSFHYGHGTHRTSDRASKEFEHISYRARQSRRDVVKMLFVVVLAFFTCWAPYHSQRFITTYYEPTSTLMMKVFEYIFYISGISIYISSTINPILYNVMSKRYRTAFRNTLKMICSCHFSTKSNHHAFVRGSKYYSSINFKAMNVNNNNNNNNNNLPANSRRQAQV